jgi:hypothetical protein
VTPVEAPGVVVAVAREHRHALIRLVATDEVLFASQRTIAPSILASLRFGDRVVVVHDPNERPGEGKRRRVLGLRREP